MKLTNNANTSSFSMQQSPTPKVIACGHLHVTVKTGNSFPAFLIQFPLLDGDGCGDAEECTSVQTDGYRCFWRTKRDFMLVSARFS